MAESRLAYGLAIIIFIFLSSTNSVSASDFAGKGAQFLYRRGVEWTDHSTLLAAVQLDHPITSMHVLVGKLCSKVSLCSADGLVVLGDSMGGVHIISPSSGEAGAVVKAPSDSALVSPVTALASLQAGRNTSMVVILAAHADGRISYHAVVHQGPSSNKKEQELVFGEPSSVVFPAFEFQDSFEAAGSSCSISLAKAIVQLEVSLPIKVAGKFSATVAVLNKDGQVATATLGMLSNEPSLTWHPNSAKLPQETGQRVASIKLAKGSVHIFNEDGSMSRISIRRAGERHVQLPTHTCRGWSDQFESTASIAAAIHDSQINLGVPPVYSITSNGSILVSKGSKGPGCGVMGSADLSSTLSDTIIESGGGVRLATVPGYVLSTTLDAHLVVVNVSGPPRNPELSIVMRQSIQNLAASVPGLENTEKEEAWLFGALFGRQKVQQGKSNQAWSSPPLIAAAYFNGGLSSSPSANGRVLIQLTPRVAALYATSLPYTHRPSNKGGSFSWMQILHPFLLAMIVGAAIHRTKTGRQQSALLRTLDTGGGGNILAPTYKSSLPSELEKRMYGTAASERHARRRKTAVAEFDDNDNSIANLRPQPPIDYAPLVESVSRLGAGDSDESIRRFVAASGSNSIEEDSGRAVWD